MVMEGHTPGGEGRLPPIGGRHSRTLHVEGGLRTRCAETNVPTGINQDQEAAASAHQNSWYWGMGPSVKHVLGVQ